MAIDTAERRYSFLSFAGEEFGMRVPDATDIDEAVDRQNELFLYFAILDSSAAANALVTLLRLEVWSDFQCAGGTRTGFIPVSECQTLVTIERTQHDDEGQLVLSKQSAAASLIETGQVIRKRKSGKVTVNDPDTEAKKA